MNPVTEFAIEAHDIVKTFNDGKFTALGGVSLQVPRGEVFGLLGPNGSGKTTMVRILSTILAPTSGSATVNGHDVFKESDKVRKSIGFAGQFAAVDENLTGFENMRMVGLLNHLDKKFVEQRAHELLASFGLTDAANRRARTYSGGMRRRLDLAAALVASPPILFLDEPTTGLDPQSRQELWNIIENLVESGTTVLLTTQYLEEADRLAKQLVVLDKGKIIAQGTSSELKAQLGNTVLVLTFQSPTDATKGAEIIKDISSKTLNIEGTVVEMTIDKGPSSAADALRRLDASGIELSGLIMREPSLDDVFLNLTGHKAEEVSPSAPTKGRRTRKVRS
jgi:ABC-2 type transport system ATP-binding protein